MLNDVEAAIPEKREEIQKYTRGGIVPTAEARAGIDERMAHIYAEGEKSLRIRFSAGSLDRTIRIRPRTVAHHDPHMNNLFDITRQDTAYVLAYLARPAMEALIDDVLDQNEPDLPDRPQRLDKLDQLGREMEALIRERDSIQRNWNKRSA